MSILSNYQDLNLKTYYKDGVTYILSSELKNKFGINYRLVAFSLAKAKSVKHNGQRYINEEDFTRALLFVITHEGDKYNVQGLTKQIREDAYKELYLKFKAVKPSKYCSENCTDAKKCLKPTNCPCEKKTSRFRKILTKLTNHVC